MAAEEMTKDDFSGVCADLATVYSAIKKLTPERYDESFHGFLEKASDAKSFECDLLFGACKLLKGGKTAEVVVVPRRL